MRWLKHVLIVALTAATAYALRPSESVAQAQSCYFQLGFKTLHDMIPDIVGDCIENEWHNAFNGDGLQRTTNGLLVWRKSDNWTAFTNGYMTWINGPYGLQSRLNTERFAWESPAPAPSPDQPGFASTGGSEGTGGGATSGGTAQPTPTPTPQANEAPSLDLSVSDDRVYAGETFTIRLRASDDRGVDGMWWWATDTSDRELKNTHTFDCNGATPCRTSWDVSTDDTGTLTIHARARDVDGNLSDEVTKEVRVRPAPTPTPTPTPTS